MARPHALLFIVTVQANLKLLPQNSTSLEENKSLGKEGLIGFKLIWGTPQPTCPSLDADTPPARDLGRERSPISHLNPRNSNALWEEVLNNKTRCFLRVIGEFVLSMSPLTTINLIIYLNPTCLAFWIQHFVPDPCGPESSHVVGYVKAGLWFFFCLFVWSNFYVQMISGSDAVWWQVELLSQYLAVWAGWWITAQVNLCL